MFSGWNFCPYRAYMGTIVTALYPNTWFTRSFLARSAHQSIKFKIFDFHYPHIPLCNFQKSVSEKMWCCLTFVCVSIFNELDVLPSDFRKSFHRTFKRYATLCVEGLPGPVKFWSCLYYACWDQSFPPNMWWFSGLWTPLIPLYFYFSFVFQFMFVARNLRGTTDLLCRLRSIAAHRDHFVRRLSVRLSVRPSVR